MPRAASTGGPPPLTLADLTREELVALVSRLRFTPIPPRDLWRVRWDALSARAAAADRSALAASKAWEAALAVTRSTPRSDALAFARAQIESDRLWKAYRATRRASDRAHAAADRAYTALDASG